MPYVAVVFSERDCKSCPARARCTRKAKGARRLKLQPQAQYLALQQARQHHASEEGRLLYNRRAGIEGTISQGVRAFELRQTRYRGLAKAHLQHIAIAAAMNLDRIVAWLEEIPRGLAPPVSGSRTRLTLSPTVFTSYAHHKEMKMAILRATVP